MGFFSSLLAQISKPDSSKMSAFAGLLFAGAAGIYFIDRGVNVRRSSRLRSAIKLRELKELGERFENRTKPLTVVVSGTVQSDEPIKCGIMRGLIHLDSDVNVKGNSLITRVQLQNDAFLSVIYEGKTEIIYEDRDSKGDQFSSRMEIASLCREVSWYLVDGTDKVRVVGIQKARGFDLIAYKREVAGPGISLLKELPYLRELDDRRGIKVLGVNHTECALKVDSPVTVVGEAVKANNGDIIIQELLFVCQPDKYLESKSILFDQVSGLQIVSMSAFVSSVIFVIEGFEYFAKRHMSSN